MTLRRPVGIIPTLPVEGAISPPLEARPRESTTEASRPHTSCIALIVACAVTAAFFAHRHERCRMPPVVERRPVNIERPELESVPNTFGLTTEILSIALTDDRSVKENRARLPRQPPERPRQRTHRRWHTVPARHQETDACCLHKHD